MSPTTRKIVRDAQEAGIADNQIASDLKDALETQGKVFSANKKSVKSLEKATEYASTAEEHKQWATGFGALACASSAVGIATFKNVNDSRAALPFAAIAALSYEAYSKAKNAATEAQSQARTKHSTATKYLETTEKLSKEFKKSPLYKGYDPNNSRGL